MIWRLVCSEKGRGSRNRIMSSISLSIRLPFCRLHEWQQATRFSQVELPPRERGITWSSVRSAGAEGPPPDLEGVRVGGWHEWQQATRFSQVELPPRERGITWSSVRSAGAKASPQYWQVLRSRSRVFLRERARGWGGRRRDP